MENNIMQSDWLFIAAIIVCAILVKAEMKITRKIRLKEIRKQRSQRLWPIATLTIRCELEEAS